MRPSSKLFDFFLSRKLAFVFFSVVGKNTFLLVSTSSGEEVLNVTVVCTDDGDDGESDVKFNKLAALLLCVSILLVLLLAINSMVVDA